MLPFLEAHPVRLFLFLRALLPSDAMHCMSFEGRQSNVRFSDDSKIPHGLHLGHTGLAPRQPLCISLASRAPVTSCPGASPGQ